jgi:anti-sigma factor RsiW
LYILLIPALTCSRRQRGISGTLRAAVHSSGSSGCGGVLCIHFHRFASVLHGGGVVSVMLRDGVLCGSVQQQQHQRQRQKSRNTRIVAKDEIKEIEPPAIIPKQYRRTCSCRIISSMLMLYVFGLS